LFSNSEAEFFGCLTAAYIWPQFYFCTPIFQCMYGNIMMLHFLFWIVFCPDPRINQIFCIGVPTALYLKIVLNSSHIKKLDYVANENCFFDHCDHSYTGYVDRDREFSSFTDELWYGCNNRLYVVADFRWCCVVAVPGTECLF
jgi:hypothetical protein